VPAQEDFTEQAAPFRAELIAHCYRMLGSVHDAEDLVQRLPARWRGYQAFEERPPCGPGCTDRDERVPACAGESGPASAAGRSWRRLKRPGCGLDGTAGSHEWLEPLLTRSRLKRRSPPGKVSGCRDDRAAGASGTPTSCADPSRCGAVQRRRVAELLETTPVAVNSSLQRARAHLAEVAPRRKSGEPTTRAP